MLNTGKSTRPAVNTRRSGVDTCWHVPVISAAAVVAASVAYVNAGFFFVGFMQEFDSDRAAATWPSMLTSIAYNFSGFIVWVLQRRYSVFRIARTASVLTWIGVLASAFAPSLPWMTVTFGAIYGIGVGVYTISLGVILMMFFDKYRGVANGIKCAGYPLSSLVFAPTLVLMLETYGFRGTLFLSGAIMTHVSAFSILLTEPLWIKKRPHVHQHDPVHKTLSPDQSQIPSVSTVKLEHETPIKGQSTWEMFSSIRRPMYYVNVLYTAAVCYSLSLFQSTIVDYTMDKGSSLSEAESMVMYLSVAQLLGSLVIPLISDLDFLKRSTLVSVTLVLIGCAFLSLPHATSFSYLVPACLLIAMLQGYLTLMPNVLMADYLGVDAIPLCWAFTGVASLPLYLSSSTIIGIFRDSMGTYDNVFRLLAGIHFFVGTIFFIVRAFEACEKKPINSNTKSIYIVNR